MEYDEEIDKYLTPLVIGVTGHRDLVPVEVDQLKSSVAGFIAELQQRFPNTPIQVMTALAEGADRLAAHVALDAGTNVQAVLPMPAEIYKEDFDSSASKADFEALCERCDVLALPISATELDALEPSGPNRNLRYANAGMYISSHCHILLAIWDGVQSDKAGGTSQIVYFQHYDRLPGLAENVPRSSLFLTDDESDLVYHILCSRRKSSSSGDTGRTVQSSWFTSDRDSPRVESMPPRYIRVFEHHDTYNSDVVRQLRRNPQWRSTEADPPPTPMYDAAARIRDFFDVADMLADHFQKRINLTLACIYSLAFLTGLTFILYSELAGFDRLIYFFLASLLFGTLLAFVAQKREWHRKYLDYRVLAEGLRVQFYRSIAGIFGEGYTKFAYDNFLRQRDMELGWIRNVMRVAGILTDAQAPRTDEVGIHFTIDHWIGTELNVGQLAYYRIKARQRSRMNRFIDTITLVCLWGGIVIACILAFFLHDRGDDVRDPLIILMGVLPLIAGIAEVYTQRKADRELTKQYQFMSRVFSNARRRLDQASDNEERREILQGVGDAALSEHAEWILVHRVRAPEPAGF